MVRTKSRPGGRPSKTKKTRNFKAAPPTPKLKKAKANPDKLPTDIANDSLQHIINAKTAVVNSKGEWDKAKKTAREYKAKFEKAYDELNRIIDEEAGNDPSLFSGPTRAAAASANGEYKPDDESWRSVPLSSLSLPKGIIETLKSEAEIVTMGDLQDYTDPNKNGGRSLTLDRIKGMGAAKLEKLEEATTAFWADQKRIQDERKAEAAEVVEEVADATVVNTDLERQLADESDADADPEAGDE